MYVKKEEKKTTLWCEVVKVDVTMLLFAISQPPLMSLTSDKQGLRGVHELATQSTYNNGGAYRVKLDVMCSFSPISQPYLTSFDSRNDSRGDATCSGNGTWEMKNISHRQDPLHFDTLLAKWLCLCRHEFHITASFDER